MHKRNEQNSLEWHHQELWLVGVMPGPQIHRNDFANRREHQKEQQYQ